MSVFISAAVWRMQFKDTSLKLVALSLADQANDDGECWPKVTSIADRAEMSPRTVQRHLSTMESSGLIVKVPRFQGERQQSNIYQFNLEAEGFQNLSIRIKSLDLPQKPKPAKADETTQELPHGPAFREAWEKWEKWLRTEKRKPLTPTSRKLQLAKCSAASEADAVASISESIERNYQSLFPKQPGNAGAAIGKSNLRRDGSLNRESAFGARERTEQGEIF